MQADCKHCHAKIDYRSDLCPYCERADPVQLTPAVQRQRQLDELKEHDPAAYRRQMLIGGSVLAALLIAVIAIVAGTGGDKQGTTADGSPGESSVRLDDNERAISRTQ